MSIWNFFSEPSNLISFAALLVAIISFISQSLFSKAANETQAELFRLSKKIDEFENRKGEVLLLNLVGRYFVINLNYLQIEGKTNTNVDRQKYLSELIQLSMDFNELTNNPYYIKFIEKHPDINLLILSLRGAIIEQENTTEAVINPQTFTFFYEMYHVLKTEVQNTQVLRHTFFVTVNDAAIFLKGIVDAKKH